MTDAGIAGELAHVPSAENVAHVARSLVHVKHGAFARDDAGRVLAAMLQQEQAVVQKLIDRRMGYGADDSAHGSRYLYGYTAVFTTGFAGRRSPGP